MRPHLFEVARGWLQRQTQLQRIAKRYAEVSTKHPQLVAATTACGVITAADATCQLTLQTDASVPYDWRRTLGLSAFGFFYYGGPCKFLYLTMDRVFKNQTRLVGHKVTIAKTFIDCWIHTPFILVPSFYLVTGVVKQQSLTEIGQQLKKEWVTASFGSALFWTPAQASVCEKAFLPRICSRTGTDGCSSVPPPLSADVRSSHDVIACTVRVPWVHPATLPDSLRGGPLLFAQDVALVAFKSRKGSRTCSGGWWCSCQSRGAGGRAKQCAKVNNRLPRSLNAKARRILLFYTRLPSPRIIRHSPLFKFNCL